MKKIICALLSVVCTWMAINVSTAENDALNISEIYYPGKFAAVYDTVLNVYLSQLDEDDDMKNTLSDFLTIKYKGVVSEVSAVVYQNNTQTVSVYFTYNGQVDSDMAANEVNLIMAKDIPAGVLRMLKTVFALMLNICDSSVPMEELLEWLSEAKAQTFIKWNNQYAITCQETEKSTLFNLHSQSE